MKKNIELTLDQYALVAESMRDNHKGVETRKEANKKVVSLARRLYPRSRKRRLEILNYYRSAKDDINKDKIKPAIDSFAVNYHELDSAKARSDCDMGAIDLIATVFEHNIRKVIELSLYYNERKATYA
jgi:hypothetical protein